MAALTPVEQVARNTLAITELQKAVRAIAHLLSDAPPPGLPDGPDPRVVAIKAIVDGIRL